MCCTTRQSDIFSIWGLMLQFGVQDVTRFRELTKYTPYQTMYTIGRNTDIAEKWRAI